MATIVPAVVDDPLPSEDGQLKVIEDNHRVQLITSLNNMRQNQTMCDVKIKCGTTDLSAHKCILSAASPYFQTVFTSSDSDSVILPIDASTMMTFLDYMYLGKLVLNPNMLGSALIASNLLQLPQIYAYCANQIIGVIDDKNYTRLWKAAEKCSDRQLQAAFVDFTCENLSTLLADKAINKCSLIQIKAILSSKRLTPEQTIHVVLDWLSQDLRNRRPYLEKLWEDIELSSEEVEQLLKKEIFNQYATVRFIIRNYLKLESSPTSSPPEIPVSSGLKTPPLPPRRPKSAMPPKRLSNTIFIPPADKLEPRRNTLYTPRIESTFYLPKPDNEYETAIIPEATPEPPPRSMSLPAVTTGEPTLLIFAVTISKRLSVQKYNLQTKAWSLSHDFPLPKQYTIPPIITTLEDKIYILGGGLTATEFDSSVYVTSISDYVRTEKSNMLLPRVHFGVVTLNGLLYVIGGRNKTGWLRDVERFNPNLNVWHQMAPLSQAKSASGVTVVQGRIYVIGGLKGHKLYSETTECYDPLADQWTQVEPLKCGRYRVGIATLETKIYMLGGATEMPRSDEFQNFLAYDTVTNSWQGIQSPEKFSDDQPCMVTWNQRLWIISRRSYCLCSYDPMDNTWTQLETSSASQHWQYIKNIILVYI